MEKVRTAVIGVGHFGNYHTSKYAEDDAAELIAVVDADTDRARTIAQDHGTKVVNHYEELLGKVDAVSITVPTIRHYDIARFFLDNGVHILVEKPFTSTIEEADDLIARARDRNLVLQVGHLERFFFNDSSLFELITRPLYIEATRVSPFQQRGADVSVVHDLMIHDIDLVAAIVNSPIRSVDAVGTPVLSDQEDIVNARLAFENGCVATITASRIASKSERQFRVFQPDSMLRADLIEKKIKRIRKTDHTDGFHLDTEERAMGGHDPLRSEIRSFLDAVANGTEPLVSGEDGREALRIAMQVVDSLKAQRDLIAQHDSATASTQAGSTA